MKTQGDVESSSRSTVTSCIERNSDRVVKCETGVVSYSIWFEEEPTNHLVNVTLALIFLVLLDFWIVYYVS